MIYFVNPDPAVATQLDEIYSNVPVLALLYFIITAFC